MSCRGRRGSRRGGRRVGSKPTHALAHCFDPRALSIHYSYLACFSFFHHWLLVLQNLAETDNKIPPNKENLDRTYSPTIWVIGPNSLVESRESCCFLPGGAQFPSVAALLAARPFARLLLRRRIVLTDMRHAGLASHDQSLSKFSIDWLASSLIMQARRI